MKLKKNIAVSETGFLFDPNSGESFSLNETGKKILSFLEEGKNEDEISKWFTDNYEVDNATFENNFNDFLTVLQNYRIVE
ncbi:MAG: HPr-rel-A system PqqD family peptide chaperone [Bacteroidales bacterium]|nr:HPr-rel-A system PqqD family peptide chaperone [Bacteroidales bacterium]